MTPTPQPTPTRCPRTLLFAFLVPALFAGRAHAGGFEFPANGTEALGRGDTFVAKADSPLALDYNVAGIADQRGTRLLFDSNLLFSNYTFQPQSGGAAVTDQAGKPFYDPWFGLTSDFGYFDRWTFALGAFGPSSIGQRTYESSPGGATRYDVTSTNVLVILPTLAVGFKANRFVSVGLEVHDAVGNYTLGNTSYSTLGAHCPVTAQMPNLNPACDSPTQVKVSSYFNPMISAGVLFHPLRFLDIGLHVRSATNLSARPIEATGTLTATTPKSLGGTVLMSDGAELDVSLPWVIRVGVRYAYKKAYREVFDLELDSTYELWSQAEGTGDTLSAPNPVTQSQMTISLPHYYNDTFSLRFGGAFNQPIGPLGLTLRAGLFYDGSATANHPEYTRMDFDTLAKLGGTAGLGLTLRGVTLNLAYAGIHSFTRTVTNGALGAINGLTGDVVTNPNGTVLAVNNGTYSDTIHIVSVGLLIQFDELVKGDAWARKPRS